MAWGMAAEIAYSSRSLRYETINEQMCICGMPWCIHANKKGWPLVMMLYAISVDCADWVYVVKIYFLDFLGNGVQVPFLCLNQSFQGSCFHVLRPSSAIFYCSFRRALPCWRAMGQWEGFWSWDNSKDGSSWSQSIAYGWCFCSGCCIMNVLNLFL